MLQRLTNAYRRTGADVPYGNPLPSHGTEMEGWFWRVTDVRLVPAGAIRRTTSGKLARRACRGDYLSGDLRAFGS